MISALILTKNEEVDLPGCLESLFWCSDIHVFDSYSTDTTIDIALKAGVTLTQRKFDDYASQRNAALNQLDFKFDWILILDADERIPAILIPQLLSNVQQAQPSVNGFRIQRRDYLGKSWLKHAQISPLYIRLVRRGKASYHRAINEVLQVDGLIQLIDGHFDHYPFSKGFSHWLNKHNHYSTMEARRWIEEQNGAEQFSLVKALSSKDFSERRFHQKGLFYKLPARPLIKWLYMVFGRRAFLDGWAGLTYATLQAIYEYLIVLKTHEMIEVTPVKVLEAVPATLAKKFRRLQTSYFRMQSKQIEA
jgi:glycosyltransferase involved in cell wall biosynthesis